MAYYTLEAGKAYLASEDLEVKSGQVPTKADLTMAQQIADAEVNHLLIEVIGAYNAAGVIAAFQSSPPPEIAALACLIGSAEILARAKVREWTALEKGQKTPAERLREMADGIKAMIRAAGYVTLADGTIYALSGRKKRGFVVENPGVRAFPLTAAATSHGLTTANNLETIFKTANIEAPL